MFFSIFLGKDDGFHRWVSVMRDHAASIGLSRRVEHLRLATGDSFGLALLRAEELLPQGSILDREADNILLVPARRRPIARRHFGCSEESAGSLSYRLNSACISFVTANGELEVAVPCATPQQVFYAGTGHGCVIADDLRIFPRLVEPDLDPCGATALLQFGVIPAPFTIYSSVRRIGGGNLLRISPQTHRRSPEILPMSGHIALEEPASSPCNSAARVQRTLDDVLVEVPEGATLLFSGGVDSALLAARVVALGRDDVTFLNFSLGPTDSESDHAVQVAAALGRECRVVQYRDSELGEMIARIGLDYSFPFGDASVVPTRMLAYALRDRLAAPEAVIEGTGADGAFAIGLAQRRWERVYNLPGYVRQAASALYSAAGLWRWQSSGERFGRIVGRSARMPLWQAFLSQNALDGIAFVTSDEMRQRLQAALVDQDASFPTDGDAAEALAMLDVMCVCAGRMAPKSFDPLRAHGVTAVYPFLMPALLSVSSSIPWTEKCEGGVEKALLKRLLASQIPRELVYRPKSGFTPPYRNLFASAPVQSLLRDLVLADDNPLLAFCRRDIVRRIVDRTTAAAPLSAGAYDFLWALAFGSAWLQQTQPARSIRIEHQIGDSQSTEALVCASGTDR